MGLSAYNKKRLFTHSPEPKGKVGKSKALHFVVQKHDSSHLHYDFRLEFDGVLHSWAVPKGPSLNPKDKRLAVEVEDHPLSYMKFEGKIPKGNYGAGEVIVWDYGLYASANDATKVERKIKKGFKEGKIKLVLYGEKLKGGFSLVKMKSEEENAWLLIKENDEYASEEVITKKSNSVLSHTALSRDHKKKIKIKAMPHNVKPMLAKTVSESFNNDEWIFELKWDGYRAITEIEKGKIKLYSRNGLDFSVKYPPIVDALKLLLPHECVLDGEIVAFEKNKPSFHGLQHYKDHLLSLQYVIFDILYLDGEDLRNLPLLERKEKLRELLNNISKNDILLFSEYIEKNGKSFFRKIKEVHMEGIIAKDATSSYHVGMRSDLWLKIKAHEEQEAIILGFTEPRKSRKYLGSLVLGAYHKGKLQYIGHSGGGFTQNELAEISKKLMKIIRVRPTVTDKIKINSPITWVKPLYVCQIKFTEWTPEGRMRHPIFMGMREDKEPKDVIVEVSKKTKVTKNVSHNP